MPELPEVETVVRDIRSHIMGHAIKNFSLQAGARRTLEGDPRAFSKAVLNQKILAVERRAKYIVLRLPVGILTVHLRMTGRLYWQKPQTKDEPYVRAVFELSGGRKLFFQDVRRFGKIKYWRDSQLLEQRLGVEPLSPDFTLELFNSLLMQSSKRLKSFLLDQKFVAGLGNIYVDESLWMSKLHPERKCNSLQPAEIKKLWQAIKKVLQAGIDNCGTSFDSFYYGAEQLGKYASLLKVFDRAGEKCKRCSFTIIKLKIASRGTHICPKCQP